MVIKMIELLIAIGIFLLIAALLLMITTAKTNTKTMTFHSNNPEDFQKFIEENNFPKEMMENLSKNGAFTTSVTTEKTTRTVKYVNGELVSDQTQTETSRPLTNCPNCGATIEPGNDGACRYCNASFNTYRINQ